jgi:hypothetical protein
MKLFRLLAAVPLLAACATLRGGEHRGMGDDAAAMRLWNQAFDAYSRDSVRISQALFQRLANEHPRSHVGHEARYYTGVLALDPRGAVDPRAAEENFRIYLADDTVPALGGVHRREAGSFMQLAHELRDPCGRRTGGLGCDTTVVSRTVTVPGGSGDTGESAAEVARLRRQVDQQAATIRDLRAELDRIRNTLAPRATPPE